MVKGAETSVDPITLEVLRNALVSLAEQMSATIRRSAYSTLIREVLDYSTALFDRHGRIVAQAATIPVHLNSMTSALEGLLAAIPLAEWAPGDVLLLNDPYHGGQHLPDFMIFAPVYRGDEIVAIVGTVGHQIDVGGRSPGSYAGDVTEIYQEGLCLPPVKLYERGVPNRAVFAILAANIREPEKTLGDIRAQVAALQIGKRGILNLIEKYGLSTFEACIDELIAYAERRMRAQIATIPDGEYRFEDVVDDDGIDPEPIRIVATVRVAGSNVIVDFTGTDRQRRGPINATLASTRSAVYFALISALDPHALANSGCYAPIRIIAPAGTVVNALRPTPVTGRMAIAHRIVTTVHGALAQAIPERIPAAFYGMSNICTVGGVRPDGRPWVFFEINPGGWGGRFNLDGLDCHSFGMHNVSNTPIEMAETVYPVRFERYELIADSGGAGEFRGGLGVRRQFRVLADAVFTAQAERFKFPPYGLHGGEPGRVGKHIVNPGPNAVSLPSKVTNYPLRAGDVVCIETQGGGGWGPPARRRPDAVAADLRAGKVTAEAARYVYGLSCTNLVHDRPSTG